MRRILPTRRAYTLRLKGANSDNWSEQLWKTHEIVNLGSNAFGDWLLTLRGGIDHELSEGDEGRCERRILLALSWLSVESRDGAPEKYIVKTGNDGKQETLKALEDILKSRNLGDKEISDWLKDCEDSITASIRDDAVWVNRSSAFDDAVRKIGDSLTREGIWDLLGRFFGEKTYLAPIIISEDENNTKTEKEGPKDLVQGAGNWLSNRFGAGKKIDFSKLASAYSKIAEWAQTVTESEKITLADLALFLEADPELDSLEGISKLLKCSGSRSGTRRCLEDIGKGAISKENLDKLHEKARKDAARCKGEVEKRGKRPWTDRILEDIQKALGDKFTYLRKEVPAGRAWHWEFAVMLDHAARRVSSGHTWIKRAEANRRKFNKDSQKINEVPENAEKWLDDYREKRSESSGAIEEYLINKRAITGWKEVTNAWKKCSTEEERIARLPDLQSDSGIDKFGDINLFRDLAADDAACVWQTDGGFDVNILQNYVIATKAKFDIRRFKVPAYRHPDPLLHPVFCDYGNSRWKISFDIHEAYKKSKSGKASGGASDVHGLKMDLWTGSELENVSLGWQSKLLEKDLRIKQIDSEEEKQTVSRASRLGRAVIGANWETLVSISSVFDDEHWNGRLQASRNELNRIARRIEKHGWDEKAVSMRKRLKWFITFSPSLQPQGPWLSYVENFEGQSPFKENNYKPAEFRLALSRLPGLRILSVDLGHRHAAACAVWETLSTNQLESLCAEEDKPTPDAMYHHISISGKRTIYRRIGSDKLPGGSTHPAPWARLERQFLIKLQGEEHDARLATVDEILEVHGFEKTLGCSTPLIDKLIGAGWSRNSRNPIQRQLFVELEQRGWKPVESQGENELSAGHDFLRVDRLMSSTVGMVRGALSRHANRARIAYLLVTDEKDMPGGIKEKLDKEGRKESIAKALALWYELATGTKWKDAQALRLWKKYLEPKCSIKELTDIVGADTASGRKKSREKLEEKLKSVAESLFDSCEELSAEWRERWNQDDKEWQGILRRLRDWILPRGAKENSKIIRNVGGLSYERITTIQSLYQAQKAYFTRITPDGVHITAGENYGRRILDDLEKMRTQRVKQLSSRIVEAALGIGRIDNKKSRASRRPIELTNKPCHAVVIENLKEYNPEETRTRRENRQLMNWSAGKVRDYLSWSCELHGLYLWEVSPRYTSRQDSRTGAPGLRCRNVSVKKFLEDSYWRREVDEAQKRAWKNKARANDEYLIKLESSLGNRNRGEAYLHIPTNGGEIFVSADSKSPASKGLQADLNAAANIGLKAITDPDWPGRWWYVLCSSKDFKPIRDKKIENSRAFDNITTLRPGLDDAEHSKATGKKSKKDKKEKINLWRDPACSSLEEGRWEHYAEYWNKVNARITNRLSRQVVW